LILITIYVQQVLGECFWDNHCEEYRDKTDRGQQETDAVLQGPCPVLHSTVVPNWGLFPPLAIGGLGAGWLLLSGWGLPLGEGGLFSQGQFLGRLSVWQRTSVFERGLASFTYLYVQSSKVLPSSRNQLG
jgi:hypothetical protein